MPDSKRTQICQSAVQDLLAAAPKIASTQALIGLDGFVDEIIAVVEKRHDHASYEAVSTIGHLSRKIAAAVGQSSNYELVVKEMKLGGNGPIMANALANIGLRVTYVGNLGYPNIHPVFGDFARKAEVISIGEPGHTDALEFDDGKIMLGKLMPLHDVNWDNLLSRVGEEVLKKLVGRSKLIGMVNWTMLPHMSRIWAKLLEAVIPHLEKHERRLFIDLADPEKRTQGDILDALSLVKRFQAHVDVILGLNLKESAEIADVLGLAGKANPEIHIQETAEVIRAKLDLACVVVHPRRGAAAATANESATFAGPFVTHPKISTGAGDHFNAGFCLARVMGLGLAQSLCVGVSTSGYYVRTGDSPTLEQLTQFMHVLPDPQESAAM